MSSKTSHLNLQKGVLPCHQLPEYDSHGIHIDRLRVWLAVQNLGGRPCGVQVFQHILLVAIPDVQIAAQGYAKGEAKITDLGERLLPSGIIIEWQVNQRTR